MKALQNTTARAATAAGQLANAGARMVDSGVQAVAGSDSRVVTLARDAVDLAADCARRGTYQLQRRASGLLYGPPSPVAAGAEPRSARDLVGLSFEQCAAVYAKANPPDERNFNGKMKGTALAIRDLDSGVSKAVWLAWQKSPVFLWGGKTVTARPTGEREGTGVNRLFEGALGSHSPALFVFEWAKVPSKLDPKDEVIRLNYNNQLRGSGWNRNLLINNVWDEVKEVSPGFFIGTASFEATSERAARGLNAILKGLGIKAQVVYGGKPTTVLYFALENEDVMAANRTHGALPLPPPVAPAPGAAAPSTVARLGATPLTGAAPAVESAP